MLHLISFVNCCNDSLAFFFKSTDLSNSVWNIWNSNSIFKIAYLQCKLGFVTILIDYANVLLLKLREICEENEAHSWHHFLHCLDSSVTKSSISWAKESSILLLEPVIYFRCMLVLIFWHMTVHLFARLILEYTTHMVVLVVHVKILSFGFFKKSAIRLLL